MNEQLDLEYDARFLARASDDDTSRAAALGSKAVQRRRVLEAYAAGGELTDVEASRIARLDRIATTRRASDLRNMGLIEQVRTPDGSIETRDLGTGRRGMVCRITLRGWEAMSRL